MTLFAIVIVLALVRDSINQFYFKTLSEFDAHGEEVTPIDHVEVSDGRLFLVDSMNGPRVWKYDVNYNFEWSRRHSYFTTNPDRVNGISFNNGHIITGSRYTDTGCPCGHKILVEKFSSSHTVEWGVKYAFDTFSGDPELAEGVCIANLHLENSSNVTGYAVLSRYRDDTSKYSTFVNMLSPEGNFQGPPILIGRDEQIFGRKIFSTPEGDLLITGHTWELSPMEAVIVKIREDGEFVWGKHVSMSGLDCEFLCAMQTSEGNYVVFGKVGKSVLIVVFGPNGEILTAKKYEAADSGLFLSVMTATRTSDGGYIMGVNTDGSSYLSDAIVLKVNRNFEIQWASKFSHPSTPGWTGYGPFVFEWESGYFFIGIGRYDSVTYDGYEGKLTYAGMTCDYTVPLDISGQDVYSSVVTRVLGNDYISNSSVSIAYVESSGFSGSMDLYTRTENERCEMDLGLLWETYPSEQSLEVCSNLLCSVKGRSTLGKTVEYSISDIENFSIDQNGTIRNTVDLDVGDYEVNVTIYVDDASLTAPLWVIVRDTEDPVWTRSLPEVIYSEFCQDLETRVNATNCGTLMYSVVGNEFVVNSSTGEIRNGIALSIGNHSLEVFAGDSLHTVQTAATVVVRDTTPPIFTDPTDYYLNLEYNDEVLEGLEVYDCSEVTFEVNNTYLFSINEDDGTLTNRRVLPLGTHIVRVTVTDLSGNPAFKRLIFTVTQSVDTSLLSETAAEETLETLEDTQEETEEMSIGNGDELTVVVVVVVVVVCIFGALMVTVVLVVVILVAIYLLLKRKVGKEKGKLDDDELDVIDPHLQINKDLFMIKYDELEIKNKIGSGGGSGATVYLAMYQNMEVAFKAYRINDFLTDNKFSEFEKEAEILASVNHKNILRFMGCTMKANRLGIVVEYCQLGDLKNFVRKQGKMEIGKKVELTKGIALGMQYLHSKNSDIPKKILIDEHHVPKIMDFGISKMIENVKSEKTFQVGTSHYMAPEVVKGEDYDNKCDVFSFSICMYELYTEIFDPYEGMTSQQTRYRIEFKVANDALFRPPIDECKESFGGNDWIINIVRNGWQEDISLRPSFEEIVNLINANQQTEEKSET